MKNVTLSYFTILKSYFINYTIPFYNTPYIPKLYYFTFSLKYYFLIFLYYFLPIITFFQDSNGNIFLGFRTLFFFQTCILQRSHFPGLCNTIFFPTVMLIPMAGPWPLSFLSNNLLFFSNLTTIPNNLPIFFFFFRKNLQFFFRKNMPNINILKLVNFKNPNTYIFHQTYQISM